MYKLVLAFVKFPEIAKVTPRYEYFLTDSIGAPLKVNLVAINLPVLLKTNDFVFLYSPASLNSHNMIVAYLNNFVTPVHFQIII